MSKPPPQTLARVRIRGACSPKLYQHHHMCYADRAETGPLFRTRMTACAIISARQVCADAPGLGRAGDCGQVGEECGQDTGRRRAGATEAAGGCRWAHGPSRGWARRVGEGAPHPRQQSPQVCSWTYHSLVRRELLARRPPRVAMTVPNRERDHRAGRHRRARGAAHGGAARGRQSGEVNRIWVSLAARRLARAVSSFSFAVSWKARGLGRVCH